MPKLTSLTEDQELLMYQTRDEWLDFVLGGKTKLNRKKATRSIQWLYSKSNLKSPVIIFVDSPLAVQYATTLAKEFIEKLSKKKVGDQVEAQVGAQVRAQVGDQVWAQVGDQVGAQVRAQVGAQVGDQVWAQVGDQVWAQVWAQVRDQVGDQVRAQVGAQVRDQVRAQVWAQVGDQVRDQVWAQVWAQVRDQVGDQVRAQVGAQVRDQVRAQVRAQVWAQVRAQVWAQVRAQVHPTIYDNLGWNAGWLAWADFYEKIGILDNSDFRKYKNYLKSGVFYGVFLDGLTVVCGCPSAVRRDNENRLHHDQLPAIEWPDGYYQHYLHGTFFDKDLFDKVTDSKLSFKDILKIKNADQRVEAWRILSPTKFLKAAKAELIHIGIKGTKLYQVPNFMDTKETEYCMIMQDPSSDRVFLEWVEPDVGKQGDADLCQATAFQIPLEDYLSIPMEMEA